MREVSGLLSMEFLLLVARKKSSMSYSSHKITVKKNSIFFFSVEES